MKMPREYALDPRKFGKDPELEWHKYSDSEAHSLEAAKLQHACVMEMRPLVRAKHGSMKAYCDATKQDYQRVGRIFRGELQMRFDDVGQAVIGLGLSVRFVSEFSSLIDPALRTVAGKTKDRNALGAFYTPSEIAHFMVGRLKLSRSSTVLEPSFGDGMFLQALADFGVDTENVIGVEVDDAASDLMTRVGLLNPENTVRKDFMVFDKGFRCDAVVGNPPYVRLRAMTTEERQRAIINGSCDSRIPIGEESSLWLPFLLKSVMHLRRGGALAFVLPYEVTYVKYARPIWKHLGSEFSEILVVRVHDRIFSGLMQDVVLLFCTGKGGTTTEIKYRCFESMSELVEDSPVIDGVIPISRVDEGGKMFQRAMVPGEVLDILYGNAGYIIDCANETSFHIGYVCGHKEFFHPPADIVSTYGIPETSLSPTILSTRQMKGFPLRTSETTAPSSLWSPPEYLSAGEQRYVSYGEGMDVHKRYKCRVRNPWWRVPLVRIPDVIMSVFSDKPRMMLNDAGWTFSNSLLGGYALNDSFDPAAFAESWYSVLTLLSIELEVHALGGGVLVAVPREAGRVKKLASARIRVKKSRLEQIAKALREDRVDDAYHVGDARLARLYGEKFVSDAWDTVELLRSWRKG